VTWLEGERAALLYSTRKARSISLDRRTIYDGRWANGRWRADGDE